MHFKSWNFNWNQISVWFKGTVTKKAQYLVVFEYKSEGDVGHVTMGPDFQTDFLMEWGCISTKYLSYAQGVMVFDSSWGEKAGESAIFKKKIGGWCGSRAHGSRSTWNFKWLLWSHGCILRLEINNMQRYWSDLNVLWMPRLSSQWLLSKNQRVMWVQGPWV